jgi:hypothetical protein
MTPNLKMSQFLLLDLTLKKNIEKYYGDTFIDTVSTRT